MLNIQRIRHKANLSAHSVLITRPAGGQLVPPAVKFKFNNRPSSQKVAFVRYIKWDKERKINQAASSSFCIHLLILLTIRLARPSKGSVDSLLFSFWRCPWASAETSLRGLEQPIQGSLEAQLASRTFPSEHGAEAYKFHHVQDCI